MWGLNSLLLDQSHMLYQASQVPLEWLILLGRVEVQIKVIDVFLKLTTALGFDFEGSRGSTALL